MTKITNTYMRRSLRGVVSLPARMSEQVDNEASELMEALDNAFPVPPSPPPLPPFLEPLSALCTDNGDAYTSTLLQTPQHTAENMDVEVSHVPRNIPKVTSYNKPFTL
jgi:hypothetical protein